MDLRRHIFRTEGMWQEQEKISISQPSKITLDLNCWDDE